MKDNTGRMVRECFSFLENDLNFEVTKEQNPESNYLIEFTSQSITIKIEKYRRELYCYVYRTGDIKTEVHLFNLLRYLLQEKLAPNSLHYFSEIGDMTESLRLQAELISSRIKENYKAISSFFYDPSYKSNLSKLNSFLVKENPKLFLK